MKNRMLSGIVAAAAVGTLAVGAVKSQVAPVHRGYYGGAYTFGDPTLAFTPYGIQNLGYGYNGYVGAGSPEPPEWEMLHSIYAEGYQDATNPDASQTVADDSENVAYPSGVALAQRGLVARVPHGSDSVKMWRVAPGRLALRWQGDPRIANSVTFELTDRAGRTLRRATVTRNPAEVRFAPPRNAAFYKATVQYVDGASNTIMSRLMR